MGKTVQKVVKGVVFEWNEAKAAENLVKHDGVAFDEAAEVFFDLGARLVDASRNDEARLGLIGYSAKSRLLFVVHVEKLDQGFRIISARRATKADRQIYEE